MIKQANINWLPLVQRTVDFFHLKKTVADFNSVVDDSLFMRPFITIAREPGSGGAPIAFAVAKKLGFELIDDQIIDDVAKSTKRRLEVIKGLDERSRSNIEDMVQSLLNPEYVGEHRFIKALYRTVLSYAHRGKVVILGRGANFITPFGKGLHVWVTAPYLTRVQRAMDFEGLDRESAKQVIADTQKKRNDFVSQYISKDVRKPNTYDLTINTQYFKIDEARDVIIAAFHKKFSNSLTNSLKKLGRNN